MSNSFHCPNSVHGDTDIPLDLLVLIVDNGCTQFIWCSHLFCSNLNHTQVQLFIEIRLNKVIYTLQPFDSYEMSLFQDHLLT